MSIQNRQSAIIAEFSQISQWEDRYKKIIEMGKALPAMDESLKRPELLIKGCQSQVWLHAEYQNGRVIFKTDSDAVIVKGLAALLVQVYSDNTPDEILSLNPDFIQAIELGTHLSPSRANGLFAMVKQIKYYAAALKALYSR